MNGTEAPKDSDLLDVADDGCDLEALQLRVDSVEAAHEVLGGALRHLTIIHRKGASRVSLYLASV